MYADLHMSSLMHLDEWPVDVSSSWLLDDNLINLLHFLVASWPSGVDFRQFRLNWISHGLASISGMSSLEFWQSSLEFGQTAEAFSNLFWETPHFGSEKKLSKSDTVGVKNQRLVKLGQIWLHVEIGSNSNMMMEAFARLWPLIFQGWRPSILCNLHLFHCSSPCRSGKA